MAKHRNHLQNWFRLVLRGSDRGISRGTVLQYTFPTLQTPWAFLEGRDGWWCRWNASLSDDDAKGIAHPDQGGRHRPLAVREPVLGYLPHKTHTSGLKLKFTIMFYLNKKKGTLEYLSCPLVGRTTKRLLSLGLFNFFS